jgi:hypothetical protein
LLLAGFGLDRLRASAEQRDFKPVDLHIKAQVNIQNQVRQVEQFNVLGWCLNRSQTGDRGRDLFCALGSSWHGKTADGKTHIWNGAVDNASGSAACWQWRRQQSDNQQSVRRYFVALCRRTVFTGQPGYVSNPPLPLAKTAAD